MSELKPCPFCGREAEYNKYGKAIDCRDCAITVSFGNTATLPAAWNTRVGPQLSEVDELREQLIKMCRVFHAEDCVCKWCNIVKERAAKGIGKMGFTPVKPKKPYTPDDYPLNSGATYTAKY